MTMPAPDINAISLAKARDALGDIANRAAYAGERTIIERRGKPVAVVISLADLEALEAFEDEADIRAYREAKAADDGTRIPLDKLRIDAE